MILHIVGWVTVWVMSFSLPNAFRAAGDVKYPTIISIVSMAVFRIGSAYLLAYVFHMGVLSVFYAMLMDWTFRCICFSVHWKSGKWKQYTAIWIWLYYLIWTDWRLVYFYCFLLSINATVKHTPPHVGERGIFLWLAQKHTKNTLCILSTVSGKLSYAMPLSTHGGNGADGSKMRQPWKKEDYDLNALLFVKGEKSLLLKICLPCRNTEEEVLLQAWLKRLANRRKSDYGDGK